MSDAPQKGTWQRWKLDDLGADFTRLEPEMIEPIQPEEVNEQDWQAELMRLRQQAEQKGFADGQAKGLEAGQQQGYAEGLEQGKQEGIRQGLEQALREQQAITDRFSALFQEFQTTLSGLDTIIPSRLVQIALSAAAQVIGHTPLYDNSVLLDHIQKLLHEETLFNTSPQLWVSPDDLSFVQERLGGALENQGWRLLSDGTIQRGGFRINTDDGELDATLDTRWNNLCRRLQEESQL